ncbi:MAG: YceI family protein [Chloroflexi bacterium]|nr:YceI family protein [Chloroflexota bacterium]
MRLGLDATTRRFWLGGAAALAAAALVAFGLWYFVLREEAPPPVSLADAVSSAAATPSPAAATPSPAAATPSPAAATPAAPPAATPTAAAVASPTTVAGAGSSGGTGEGLEGTWSLAAGGDSFVGYRVREELVGIGAKTAVGRTSAVSGAIEFDGSAITVVSVEADLTQLQSDDSRRDRALRGRGIETSRFPTAAFELAEPIVIDGPLEEDVPVAATAVGRLTLHGVTRTIEIGLEGQLSGGRVVVVGSTEIEFSDYEIVAPSAPIVLSIEDRGVMEFQLIFERT